MSTQISESAATLQANIDTLEGQITAGTVTAITLTDANTPTMTITAAQYSADSGVLQAISSNYNLEVTGVSATSALLYLLDPHVAGITVVDVGLAVGLELDALQDLANVGRLNSITLTDGSSLTVSQTAITVDAGAIAKISGTVDFSIIAPDSGGAVTGASGHANIVDITGLPAQFTFTGSSDHQTLTASNGTESYTLSGIQAVHFSDGTQLVVAQTPGDANHVDTGNIAELYAAVLARVPDLDGLTFYQNALQTNPTTSLLTFADYFLNSTEYKSNTAHNYDVSSAGDIAFIQDSYQNLLGRTPTTSEIDFYLTNVMQKAEAGLTANTTAFASAQFQAHALMLVYFSASTEFLSDVQVTATNTGSTHHWLVLS